MTDPALLQPHVLREYALLADGERGAVLGPRGDIAWMCAPRWDSPSVFATLAGGTGVYSVTPRGRFVWGGYYEPNSLIWRNRWVTTDGIIECREALAYPADPRRLVLLRSVHALDGASARRRHPAARAANYDTTDDAPPSTTTAGRGPSAAASCTCAGRAVPGARHRDGALTAHLDLARGGDARIWCWRSATGPCPTSRPIRDGLAGHRGVVAGGRVHARRPRSPPATPRTAWPCCAGLTSSAGGMVAAATTSLPERAEAGRNYDYRYAWIRDQCYAGQAAAVGRCRRPARRRRRLRFGSAARARPAPRARVHRRRPGACRPSRRLQPARLSRRDRRDRQPGAQPVPTRRVRRGAAAVRCRGRGRTVSTATAGRRPRSRRRPSPSGGRSPTPASGNSTTRRWTHSRLTASAGLRAMAGVDRQPAGRALARRSPTSILAHTGAHAAASRWVLAARRERSEPRRGAAAARDPRRGRRRTTRVRARRWTPTCAS